MSYETNWASTSSDRDVKLMKRECDKLARIACKAMEELVSQGKADFLLLRDTEVLDWWTKHQEDDRKHREAEEEKRRRAQIREAALSKLTDEEKKILRIK